MMSIVLAMSPFLALAIGGSLLVLSEVLAHLSKWFRPSPSREVPLAGGGNSAELGIVTALILFSGALASAVIWNVGPERFLGLNVIAPYLLVDRFSLFFFVLICVSGGLVALLAGGFQGRPQAEQAEFFPLLVFTALGAMAVVAAGDLLSVSAALGVLSLGSSLMMGLRGQELRGSEAQLKYFLQSTFSVAIFLFGAALLYGATGYSDLASIGVSLSGMHGPHLASAAALVLPGVALIVVSLAMAVGAVPFHSWVPDAYEGASTPTSGFMAAVVNTAVFALLLRVLLSSLADERLASWGAGWPPILGLLAFLSMGFGNLVAARQVSVKRMLGYCTVSQVGYLLVAVVAISQTPAAQEAILFYLLTYALSALGVMGALILAGGGGKDASTLEDLAGLGRRSPGVALVMTIFLASLAGLPLTGGFLAKVYLFQTVFGSELHFLAGVGLCSSVIAAYYCSKVIVYLYMREKKSDLPTGASVSSASVSFALIVMASIVLALGVFPESAISIAAAAVLP